MRLAAIFVLVAAGATITAAASAQGAKSAPVGLEAVSNRADLVAGGDVLVRVTLPKSGSADSVTLSLNGRALSNALHAAPNGVPGVDGNGYLALVNGLSVGRNTITASVSHDTAKLEVTNHPVGGPVFSGPQIQPWLCTTQANGLGPAQDSQCNAPTIVQYFYKPTPAAKGGTDGPPANPADNPVFLPYDPNNPPAAEDIAITDTDQGVVVPEIVRREQGTIDRGIYDISVLFDPAKPWTAWAPQSGWNHKLTTGFPGGCGATHGQGNLVGSLLDEELSRGFMVASSTLFNTGQDCNEVVQAEALMMLKEHVTEQYGEIRYTIGFGCSGGAIASNMIPEMYPGLIDGIVPECSFPDMDTLIVQDWNDCHLLNNYFASVSPQLWSSEAQQTAVEGFKNTDTCHVSPGINTALESSRGLPADQLYNATTNPGGVRATAQDYMVNEWGTRPASIWTPQEKAAGFGFANSYYDNVGIQYGLEALLAGKITSAQFLDLNQKIGGLDIDKNVVSSRTEADPGSVATAYRTGMTNDMSQEDNIAILDLRGTSNEEYHTDFWSYAQRQRLINANGNADNQVIWTGRPQLTGDPVWAYTALPLMDKWLSAVEADKSSVPLSKKIAHDKPVAAGAQDACYFSGQPVTDTQICKTAYPYFADARQAAGGPITNDVVKCQLKPLNRSDYRDASMPFTDAQWSQLQQIFPEGVCDYSKPAVGKTANLPWLTYAGGPGGKPLGPAPAATITRR
jgi:hypothetical protein